MGFSPVQEMMLEGSYEPFLDSLDDEETILHLKDWRSWARPNQLPPPRRKGWRAKDEDYWKIWFLKAGRGFGKTRAAAEAYIEKVRSDPPNSKGLLIGATIDDARFVMIEGESGLLSCAHEYRPVWEPGNRRLLWPEGKECLVRSADRPDRMRGPQHHRLWGDEFAAWRFATEALDMALKGLRLGSDPWGILSSTPKSTEDVINLVDSPDVIVTGGSSYDNLMNLSESFEAELNKGRGSSYWKQEVLGLLIRAVAGALWDTGLLHRCRVKELPELDEVVVGVDPTETYGEDSDACGIVVNGRAGDVGYTIDDLTLKGPPEKWAQRVIEAALDYEADSIVAEINAGGLMVERLIRAEAEIMGAPIPPIHTVRAKKGKLLRAEPVYHRYTRGKWFHYGTFAGLESQMCSYVPGVTKKSPDNLDAHVYSALKLFPVQRMEAVGYSRKRRPVGW